MKLTELDAQFINEGYPYRDFTGRFGMGIIFRCPCCRNYFPVYFKNPIDGMSQAEPANKNDTHRWDRAGITLDDLTLSPSVNFQIKDRHGNIIKQHWHGHIKNGEVTNA